MSAKSQLCKYYLGSGCRKGDSCRFGHDRFGHDRFDTACSFHKVGKCKYGDTCRFSHSEPMHDLSASRNKTCGMCLQTVLEKAIGSIRSVLCYTVNIISFVRVCSHVGIILYIMHSKPHITIIEL